MVPRGVVSEIRRSPSFFLNAIEQFLFTGACGVCTDKSIGFNGYLASETRLLVFYFNVAMKSTLASSITVSFLINIAGHGGPRSMEHVNIIQG